jgi:hypothetical protein
MYSSTKDKITGLKAHLKFRKEVLHLKPKDNDLKNVFSFSKLVDGKRVQLSLDELTQNVKSLVSHALKIPSTDDSDGPVLVGMNVRMRFQTDDGTNWYKGYVISKVVQFIPHPDSYQKEVTIAFIVNFLTAELHVQSRLQCYMLFY